MKNQNRDSLMLKILLFANLITLQLVLMSPALTVPARNHYCALICALLYILTAVGFYFTALRLPKKYYAPVKYLPAPVITGAVSLFFMEPAHALMCALLTAVSEFLLIQINDRIRTSGIRPALRLIAELISAGVLSMAVLGLRF